MPLNHKTLKSFIKICQGFFSVQALWYSLCKSLVVSLSRNSPALERYLISCTLLIPAPTFPVFPVSGRQDRISGARSLGTIEWLMCPLSGICVVFISTQVSSRSWDAAKNFRAQEEREIRGGISTCIQDACLSLGHFWHLSIHLSLQSKPWCWVTEAGGLMLGTHLHRLPPAAASAHISYPQPAPSLQLPSEPPSPYLFAGHL